MMPQAPEVHGSPPRVRGKRRETKRKACRNRITPARAGKTSPTAPCTSAGRDHPRACGENKAGVLQSVDGSGSPPRVRGKHGRACEQVQQPGITPARAGKTRTDCRRNRRVEDHPRACGENAAGLATMDAVQGSPPRVRGKLHAPAGRKGGSRITPARAGKTPE